MSESELSRLIERAIEAVEQGADIYHPAIRALVPHVRRAEKVCNLASYRASRRGLGLSPRSARERLLLIDAYADVAKKRDEK